MTLIVLALLAWVLRLALVGIATYQVTRAYTFPDCHIRRRYLGRGAVALYVLLAAIVGAR